MVWFLLLSLPLSFAFAFFIRLQTYVLIVELVINAVGIFFMGSEFLFGIVAFIQFKNNEKT